MSESSTTKVDLLLDGVRHSLEEGRLAHAYLVVGSPTGGALELAVRLLALVFESGGGAAEGLAGRIETRRHPDITWLEPKSKGRIIQVDDMRKLNQRIATTSFEGGWKAGVILYADRLNPAAANAFLKTLEEPPPRSLLLLVTESPQNLLPTILSRCQVLNLRDPTRPHLGAWGDGLLDILREGPPQNPLEACCRAGRMARLLKEERARIEAEEEESGEDEADEAGTADPDGKIADARISARLRAAQEQIMQSLMLWHRDVLVCTAGGPRDVLHYHDEEEVLARIGASLDGKSVLAMMASVDEGRLRLEQNLPPLAVFEGMFVEQGRAFQIAKTGRKTAAAAG